MLDDLRNSAVSSFEEESPTEEEIITAHPAAKRPPFLGMTAAQRFVITLLLLFMACIFGTFCLILTERIWIPGF